MKNIILIAVLLVGALGASIDQSDFYAQQLALEELPFYAESGYIDLKQIEEATKNEDAGSLFYQLYLKDGVKQLEDVKAGDIFALWLNGGPGSSSQFGNYDEIGPFEITRGDDKKLKVTLRQKSWNKIMHQLFVDQPFNVGMSSVAKGYQVKDTDTAAKYLTLFLTQFFDSHPTLKNADFYIFGESFAGHYIPATAVEILKTAKSIKFKGVAIGDGWTSPFQQMGYYGSYLYNLGLIDDATRDKVITEIAKGQNLILNDDYLGGKEVFEKLTDEDLGFLKFNGMSVYNIQQYSTGQDGDSTAPYVEFLNNNLDNFQSKVQKFSSSNDEVYKAFAQDIPQTREQDVVTLLTEGNLRVLLFNGQLDYIVNTPGALTWINQLKWSGIKDWRVAQKKFITTNGQTQGSVKRFNNFYYATVYRAGHMVPTDNPDGAYEMIEKFLTDPTWGS